MRGGRADEAGGAEALGETQRGVGGEFELALPVAAVLDQPEDLPSKEDDATWKEGAGECRRACTAADLWRTTTSLNAPSTSQCSTAWPSASAITPTFTACSSAGVIAGSLSMADFTHAALGFFGFFGAEGPTPSGPSHASHCSTSCSTVRRYEAIK